MNGLPKSAKSRTTQRIKCHQVKFLLPLFIFNFPNTLTSAVYLTLPFLFQFPEVSDLADFTNGQPRHTLQARNVNIGVFVKLLQDDRCLRTHFSPYLSLVKKTKLFYSYIVILIPANPINPRPRSSKVSGFGTEAAQLSPG